jgi:hypothetical protein
MLYVYEYSTTLLLFVQERAWIERTAIAWHAAYAEMSK